jgi:aminoglycoside phosphotransferase (APT) family kinase protein
MVGALLPSLAPRLSYLLERLSRNVPDPGDPLLSHGDFHAGQLLETGGVFAVIDFDSMCVAPAALDIATYVAHTVRGDEGDLDRAGEVLARIIDGYGTTPDALRWYLVTALLRRAPFPFRYLDDQWPERIEAMLDMAEETMRR